MEKRLDAICVGAAVVDIPLRPVCRDMFEIESYPLEQISMTIGGDAINEATIMSRLGHRIGLMSMVGKDAVGAFIREHCSLNVIAACYPEGHTESENIAADIRNLKTKVDAGADQLITQLFFDNDYFYRFRERCSLAGIHVPIQAGIMPVVNKKQIERMVSLCGVKLPQKFISMMERYGDNPAAMRDAGIAYAVDQIVDLAAHGVDGIHLYTMNNPYIANKIHESVFRLMAS